MLNGVKQKAACGIAVFFEDTDGTTYFHGFFGALLAMDAKQPTFLGTMKGTPGASEINGMVWVFLWILQAQQSRFVIYYDCMYAEQVTMAKATPRVNKPLVTIPAGLMSFASQCNTVQTQHIYSHKGHAWNELADHICTSTSLRGWDVASVLHGYRTTKQRDGWYSTYLMKTP